MGRAPTPETASVPFFLYGTAWKEERTEALVRMALERGFRGVDTANQRKHYVESDVGAALTAFVAEGRARRDELFVQTKFTYAAGQDERLPYDPSAPLATQVAQSFASSLEHLRTTYVDSYLLHGPLHGNGLAPEDVEVWRAMERLHERGDAKRLGISNVSREQLASLVRVAEVKPSFVQNRCYARSGWDRDVRIFCADHGITYQAFSLLTANGRELGRPEVARIARRTGRSIPELVFRFAIEAGMLPLTGSSDPVHLDRDLAVQAFQLERADRETLAWIGLA